MSERDQARDDSGDSTGDWVRAYSREHRHQDWHVGRTNTTNPLTYGKVKKATERHPFTTEFEDTVLNTVTELAELLIKKHKDYGPLNVANAPGGALNGLRVRIHDKQARINHLLDSGATPENESLEDSFKDMANYAIIALLVMRNQWPTK